MVWAAPRPLDQIIYLRCRENLSPGNHRGGRMPIGDDVVEGFVRVRVLEVVRRKRRSDQTGTTGTVLTVTLCAKGAEKLSASAGDRSTTQVRWKLDGRIGFPRTYEGDQGGDFIFCQRPTLRIQERRHALIGLALRDDGPQGCVVARLEIQGRADRSDDVGHIGGVGAAFAEVTVT